MAAPEPRSVLHVVASFTERDGGSARSIADLCGELAGRGLQVTVLASSPADGRFMPVAAGISVCSVLPPRGLAALRPGAGRMSAAVTAWCRRHPDGLVHLHGLWRPVMHEAARAARRCRRPVVWAPMGMLEPWALRHHAWKKRLVWWAYQRRDLQLASVLQVTSRLEAEGVQATGLQVPAVVIPLGVSLPPPAPVRAPAGRRTALFLSRLHPKKGVLDLLAAWSRLRPTGWRLRIVGPDEVGQAALATRFIREHGLLADVSLEGPVWGEAKAAAYAGADLFVLPTYSENFGLVVAEAMAAGLPVLTTRATPWRELAEEGCGWWIEPGQAALEPALRAALAVPLAELQAMGARGRDVVARRYSWTAVGKATLELYHSLLAPAGAPPHHLLFPQLKPNIQS